MTPAPLLVCDLDGTLVDTLPDLAAAVNRLLAVRGLPPLSEAEIRSMVGDGTKKLVERAFAARGQRAGPEADAAYVADYTAHVAVASRPFPGVDATLQQLSETGWRFAICTNKSTTATKALLGALGLAHWFSALGCSDTFAVRKPDPAHLKGTIALAGGAPERSIVIGDHANDMIGALALGIPAIFAGWGYGDRKMAAGAAAIAEHFSNVAELAPRLMSASLRGA